MGWGHLGEEPGHYQANVLSPLGGVGVVRVQVLGKLQRHELKSIWEEAETGEVVSPAQSDCLSVEGSHTWWSGTAPGLRPCVAAVALGRACLTGCRLTITNHRDLDNDEQGHGTQGQESQETPP